MYSWRTYSLICFRIFTDDQVLRALESACSTLVFSVTAQDDLSGSIPVKSSQHTEVFVRKLPIEEEELQCTISPEVGGKAIETKYHMNCTALHVKFDLYRGNDTDFYKYHTIQFVKKIFLESETEGMFSYQYTSKKRMFSGYIGISLTVCLRICVPPSVHRCTKYW